MIIKFWWTGASTDDRYSNEHEIYSTDLFLHVYEADFLQVFLNNKARNITQIFNFSFRYIDDVLSLTNSRFGDYIYLMNPNELEVNDTTDSLTLTFNLTSTTRDD